MDWTAIGSSLLNNAATAGSFGKGLATGAGQGLASTAEGLWSLGKGAVTDAAKLATDPAYREATFNQASAMAHSTADYGGKLIDDPVTREQAYEEVQHLAGSLKQQYTAARDLAEREGRLAEFYGQVAGRGGFEVGMFLVPVSKLAAVGKAAEGAEVARVAEVASALGDVRAAEVVQGCKAASAAAKVVDVRSAEAANEAMVTAGRLPAWMAGTEVVTEVVPAGTKFQMVVSEGQAQALMRGRPAFGGFATSEAVSSQTYARDKLVILEEFKDDVSRVVSVETTAEQTIQRGISGPLTNALGQTYGGGVQQVEFIGDKALKLIGTATSLPVK
jgi:hypothetical protein